MRILLALAVLTACAPTPYPPLSPAVQDEISKHCFPRLEDTGRKINLCPAARAWLQQVWEIQHQQ